MNKNKWVAEAFWGAIFFSGFTWLAINELIFDSKDNYILLTQVSMLVGGVTVLGFMGSTDFFDKILRCLFFPALSIAICVAIGRLYLDFDHGGPFIALFQSTHAPYADNTLYSMADFLFHYIYPIGFTHLYLNNKSRLKQIFYGSSNKEVIFQYLAPIFLFAFWYIGLSLEGLTLKDLYLTDNVGMPQLTLILLLIPLVTTVPLHHSLASEQSRESLVKLSRYGVYMGSFLLCSLSLLAYKPHLLYENIAFLTSLLVLIVFSLFYLGVLSKERYAFLLPVIVSTSIFSFFINEFQILSEGGRAALYLNFLKEGTSYNVLKIHYLIKAIFYLCMVVMLYAHYSFLIADFLESKISRKTLKTYMLRVIFISLGSFVSLYVVGIFNHYDIKGTELDIVIFATLMVCSLEFVLPLRHVLRVLKQP